MSAGSLPPAGREYYSIGEVCELLDVKAHVLRYWERQIPQLRPGKNRAGNRVYQARQIHLIALLKRLLHEDKYTMEGAKRKLEKLRDDGQIPPEGKRALDQETLEALRQELRRLESILAGGEG